MSETTATTTAETRQPEGINMPDLPDGTGMFATITGVIGAILWLRRKVSRDNLEVVKDGSEASMLRISMEREQKAMENAADAWRKREEDAKLIGKLSSDVDYLTTINKGLVHDLNGLKQEVRLLRSVLVRLMDLPRVKEVLETGTQQETGLGAALKIALEEKPNETST